MITKQKKTDLGELINTLGIYRAIEMLERKLKGYERTRTALKDHYAVQYELECAVKELLKLKVTLSDLVDQSTLWEAWE